MDDFTAGDAPPGPPDPALIVQQLGPALRDKQQQIRIRLAAVRGLRAYGYRAALLPLTVTFTDPQEPAPLRQAAAEAVEDLLAFCDYWFADEALVATLRQDALESLIRVMLNKAEDGGTRWVAANLLTYLADPRSVEPFLALLRDRTDDPQLRSRALRGLRLALQILAPGEAVPEALLLLLGDSADHPQVRAEAVRAWWDRRDARVVEPLLLCLFETDANLAHDAAIALGRQGDPRAVVPLIALLDHPDSHVVSGAAVALGDLADRRAVEPLLRALAGFGGSTAQCIIWALGKLGNPRALEPLLIQLDSANPDLRSWAARALGDLGDRRAVEPLIQMFRRGIAAGDLGMWQSTAEALGQLQDMRATDTLLEFLEYKDFSIRCTVVYHLGSTGDRRAVGPLIEVLQDSDPRIREAAVRSLGLLGDPAAIPALEQLRAREPRLEVEGVGYDVHYALTAALARLPAAPA